MEYALYAVTLAAALMCPWWVTLPLLVLTLGLPNGGPVAVAGAIILDSLHGSNVASLYGVSLLYTIIFGALAFLAISVRRYVID